MQESTLSTHTLRSLDQSKIRRITVTRRNGAVRMMKERENIAHFIRNHANDEVIESKLWSGYASSKPGTDYVALVIACVEKSA